VGQAVIPAVAELVEMVVANPQRVGADAAARLAAGAYAGDRELAQLHWVLGRAEREAGHVERGRLHLEEALTVADRVGDRDLLIGIQSSLAFALARLGELDAAEKLIESAELLAGRVERARLMAQRGVVTYLRGDLARGADILTAACEAMKRNHDVVNEARHRANLGTVLSNLGRYSSARRQLDRAIAVAEGQGLDVVIGAAKASLGVVLTLQGDLPDAIREFTEAERRHVATDSVSYLPLVHVDHARALADAGLLDDAERLLERAISMLRWQGQLTDLPTALFRIAEVRLAKGDHAGAIAASEEATGLFAAQRRDRWAALVRSIALRIRSRLPGADASVVDGLHEVADQLRTSGWLGEAVRARLVAARLAIALGVEARDDGSPIIDAGLRNEVRLGRPADRVLLAHVDAIAAYERGDRGAARRAISHGLRVAVGTQAGLGAMETRAHAARYGNDLTEFGARMAMEDRRPRELLERIEATRLMSTRTPRLRPPDDEAMAAMLTELRAVATRIADPRADASRRLDDELQRAQLERAVIRHARGVRGDSTEVRPWEHELHEALGMLGPRTLLAYAAVGGRLVAVSVRRRRARLHEVGSVAAIGPRLDAAAFALSRLNRRQGSVASRAAAADLLRGVVRELADQLLPAEVLAGDGPLVLVPTARLHDVPWALLPGLQGRPLSVSPSVSAWAAAERVRADRRALHGGDRAAGVIAGPELEHAPAEAHAVAGHYLSPTVLSGERATVIRCLEVVAGVDVAHFACHGTFRTDNPMFSSLRLEDGPVVVYDFERLSRLPETVVLSACSTANANPLHGGSMLGLAAALLTLGTANVIAPVGPIADAATAPLMASLHRAMAGGTTPSEALALALDEPGVNRATAGAFIALGA